MNNKVADIVTDQIIKKLEQGTIAWHKTWKVDRPQNFKTKRPYRGINILLLGMTDFNCPYWASFKQISELGGKVKKGSKGTMIIYWKILEYTEKGNNKGENKTKKIPLLRYYKIFNLEQTTGIEYKTEIKKFNPIEKAEEIVAGYKTKPDIKNNTERAYYSPVLDYISIPEQERFELPEHYYTTLFHELVHSTGAVHRLKRKTVTDATFFGSESYSKEELVAELGASFLSAESNIEQKTLNNSASYIAGWLQQLKNDKTLIIHASALASKAVDYILNKEKVEQVKEKVKQEALNVKT